MSNREDLLSDHNHYLNMTIAIILFLFMEV